MQNKVVFLLSKLIKIDKILIYSLTMLLNHNFAVERLLIYLVFLSY